MPFIKELRDEISDRAARDGYITTILGRRRRFNQWEPKYWQQSGDPRALGLPLEQAVEKYGPRLRRAHTHKALNADIQGSAADLMKKAMQQYWVSGAAGILRAPLLTVHDELDFSVPKTKAAAAALTETREMLESCIKLSVPIIADMKRGPDWGTCK